MLLISWGAFGLVNYAMTPKTKLPWIYDEAQALTLARSKHMPMLVDFWAIYCTPCKLMETTLFSQPVVRKELSRFVLFKVDVSQDTDRDQQLRDKYKAPSELPLLVFVDSDGKERARAGKIESVSEMLDILHRVR